MTRRTFVLCALVITGCGTPPHTQQTVDISSDDASTGLAPRTAPPPPDIGCAIQFDREEMNHMLALDECLGTSRSNCWSGCEGTCTSCGVACAGDAACEAHCRTERDTCKLHHCVDVHDQCRTDLVRNWLSNKCDVLCAPFHACVAQCSENPSSTCQSKCDAIATSACNPYRCDALLNAPERKTLDPRWRSNNCDRVCSKVWQCAATQCSKSSCGEAVKMFLPCVARVPGANACGLAQSQSLCPEP